MLAVVELVALVVVEVVLLVVGAGAWSSPPHAVRTRGMARGMARAKWRMFMGCPS
ncbi:hypothetical protein [Corynebacterium variabile]|uniref:hypothetical protein n=1 Tax=Corynebacterium variabile TaxID=1727 RepID=UPI00289CD43B|nr:hypothetical protein [Corynebacterium variabile]